MFLVALACTSPETGDGPARTTPEQPADTDVSPVDTGDAPPPEVPLIGEALAERCPQPNPGEPFEAGTLLRRATLSGLGHCNDGSPPLIYVRAATDLAHVNDWVWLFDGGGLCPSYEACAIRWCGEDPPFGARDMSSLYLPAARGGEGITSQDEWNSFREWNLVFAAYCSSDQWSGTKGEHVFEGDPPYRLFFEGAVVAADGIAAAVAGVTSDDGTVQLPSLADATTVVVGGISAGTHGAALHREAIAAAAPVADVVTVLDSTFYASPDVMDPPLVEAFATQLARIWNDTAVPAWGALVHESCALAHATEPWRCLSMETVMREGHVEGNVLWIHDLRDDVIYDYYEAIGVSEGLYQQLGVDTARLFEDEVPLVSVYGYSCGIHTTIDANGTFSNYSVVDAENGGPALTIHDALLSVLDGNRVVAVDSAPPANSICY